MGNPVPKDETPESSLQNPEPVHFGEDVRKLDIESIIAQAEEPNCFFFTSPLVHASKEASEPLAATWYETLSKIVSLKLVAGDKTAPLQRMGSGVFASPGVEDIEATWFPVLEALAPDVRSPELRARIADFLWIRRRGVRFAQMAIDAYLDTRTEFKKRDRAVDLTLRLERAFRLAVQIRDRDRREFCIATIEDAVHHEWQKQQEDFVLLWQARLFREHYIGQPADWTATLQKRAAELQSIRRFDAGREFLTVAEDWASLTQDPAKRLELQLAQAESWVTEADCARIASGGHQMRVAYFLRQAIEAYRRLPQQSTRIEQLRHELEEAQRAGLKEFVPISTKIDLSEMSNHACAAVSGKSLMDALFAFSNLDWPPSRERLERQVRANVERFPLSHLFSAAVYDKQGRLVAQRPHAVTDDEELQQAWIESEVLEYAKRHRQLLVQGMVLPALRVLASEHPMTPYDIMSMLRSNPLVPPGSEIIFARGISAGFHFDFLMATSLLVPQLERAIRFVLQHAGRLTHKQTSVGVQPIEMLPDLLRSSEFVACFGEDRALELRGLLVEQFGDNLRNRLAHGLLDYDDHYGSDCIFCWWVTIQLVMLPLRHPREANGGSLGEQVTE